MDCALTRPGGPDPTWPVVRLKTTGGDHNHVQNHIQTLSIPFVHRATGPMNLRVSWFLERPNSFGPWDMASMKYVGPKPSLCPQYRSTPRTTRRVPAHAFVRMRRNGYADAWILVQRESVHDGSLQPVTDIGEVERLLDRIPDEPNGNRRNPLLRAAWGDGTQGW